MARFPSKSSQRFSPHNFFAIKNTLYVIVIIIMKLLKLDDFLQHQVLGTPTEETWRTKTSWRWAFLSTKPSLSPSTLLDSTKTPLTCSDSCFGLSPRTGPPLLRRWSIHTLTRSDRGSACYQTVSTFYNVASIEDLHKIQFERAWNFSILWRDICFWWGWGGRRWWGDMTSCGGKGKGGSDELSVLLFLSTIIIMSYDVTVIIVSSVYSCVNLHNPRLQSCSQPGTKTDRKSCFR